MNKLKNFLRKFDYSKIEFSEKTLASPEICLRQISEDGGYVWTDSAKNISPYMKTLILALVYDKDISYFPQDMIEEAKSYFLSD